MSNMVITQLTFFKSNDGLFNTSNCLFTGIPFVLEVGYSSPDSLAFYLNNNEFQFNLTTDVPDKALGIYLESTLINDVNTPIFGGMDGYYPKVINGNTNASTAGKYKIYRYFTDLQGVDEINMNNNISVLIHWSSSDISGDYSRDLVYLSLVNSDYTFIRDIKSTENNVNLTNNSFYNIPSGNYRIYYNFKINTYFSAGFKIGFSKTSTSQISPYTNIFKFTSEYVHSITVPNSTIGSSSNIKINVGNGYTGYTYTLSFALDSAPTIILDSLKTAFPTDYIFSPVIFQTNDTYRATIVNTTDPNDTIYTTFQLTGTVITSITITPKIVESKINALNWVGGVDTEQFFYPIDETTNQQLSRTGVGNLNDFERGQYISTSSSNILYNTSYSIQPDNDAENTMAYGSYYFDTIPSRIKQTVTLSEPFLSSTSVLSWISGYNLDNVSPDGVRNYKIYFNNDLYSVTSVYNTLTFAETISTENTYSIKVEDILIAENFKFYKKPNMTVTKKYINFKNTISWDTPDRLTMNIVDSSNTIKTTFTSIISPIDTKVFKSSDFLTDTDYDIQCFTPVSTSSQLCGTFKLTLQTFDEFWTGGTNSIIDGILLTDTFKSDFLYSSGETYSLSLYKVDGTIIPLTDADGNVLNSITFGVTGYIWYPYQTNTLYASSDTLLLISNNYFNFGYSLPFTLTIPTPTISLDKNAGVEITEFTFVSKITATIDFGISDYIDTFTVTLCAIDTITQPTPISLIKYTTSSSTYLFKPYENYTPENVYFFQNNDVYLHFESQSNVSITFNSSTFKINPNYLTITNESRKYYTIEKNTFTLKYDITTTSDYTDTIDISIFPTFSTTKPIGPLTNTLSSSTFTYDFYAYKYVFDEIYLLSSLQLIFESFVKIPIILISNNFTLDGNSITSPNDGVTYNILDTIEISWDKIKNVITDTNYHVSETFSLTATIDGTQHEIATSVTPYSWKITDSLYIGTFDIYIQSSLYLIFTTISVTVENDISVELDKKNGEEIREYTIISTVTATIIVPSSNTYSDTFTVKLYNESGFLENLLDFNFSNDSPSYLFYPFQHDETYYVTKVYLLFTSTSVTGLTIQSIQFLINSNYLIITIPNLKETYYTIEPIPFTLDYKVTTTSIFTENVTVVVGTETPTSYPIDLSNGIYKINNDWYPYKYVFDENNLGIDIFLTINSKLETTKSNAFRLDGQCITSQNDGMTYSILTPILISWDKIKNVTTDYNVSEFFYLKLNNTNIATSTTPYLWEVYKTNYTGTFDLLIHSVDYLIFNTFTITINKASQADYGILQNKKLGVAPCSSLSLTPALSRATTNNICITNKKNNIPMTTIKLGDRRFLVPCGVVKYLPELKSLITKMSLRDALFFLIQKYDIEVQRRHIINKKRYVYPTADAKINYPILQFNTSFRLSEYNTGAFIVKNPIFIEKTQDARILEVCNDDTKTFSTLYTDMLKNATYWLTTLPSFQESSYTFCIIRPTNGSLKKVISGSIALFGNILVFTPIILRSLLFFYEPYPPNTDITIVYSNPDVSKVVEHIQQKYFQDSVVINSSCL